MARVASQNLFDILGDDDDIEAKIGLSNNTTPTQNETVVVQKHVDRSRASPKESRIRHEYPQFGNADNRSGPRDHNVGRRREDNDNNYNNNNYQSRSSRGSRSGERGRGRGGRRGGGREFDRHSGSGRYDSEKNDKNESLSWESNNANWGNSYGTNSTDKIDNNDNSNAFSSNWELDNNDNAANDNNTWNVTESQEPTNDWGSKDESGGGDGDSGWDGGKAEASPWEIQEEPTYEASGADNKNNENIGEDEATTKPVETEEVIKTLEEYLSEKAQKVLDISLPEVRKPNEGVDDSQWRDAVPLEKKEDGDILFSGKEHSFKIKNKTKKSKNFLEIKPTFDKPGGFQRGGRGGGGRGRGGRGGGGDRNRDDYDNRDNRRGGGGGGDNNRDDRDNRRGGGGGGDNNRDNRDNRRGGGGGGGGGGGERSYDYNNNRRGGGGARSYDYNNSRRGGGGNRSNYVNIDDQGAFPSLGTV